MRPRNKLDTASRGARAKRHLEKKIQRKLEEILIDQGVEEYLKRLLDEGNTIHSKPKHRLEE
jgi:hypothetical protein